MTEHQKISVVIGIGALLVLVFLLRHKAGAGVASVSDGAVAGTPVYPQNPTPVSAGDLTIGGSPVNLTYNYAAPIPVVRTFAAGDNTGGECGGCDSNCEAAGQKVSVQNVQKSLYDSALANYEAYQKKLTSTAHFGTA